MMDIITFEATIDRFKGFFTDSFVLIYEEIFNKVLPKDSVQFFPPKLYEMYLQNVVYESVQGVDEQQPKQPKRSAPSDESTPHETDGKSPGPKANTESHGKKSEEVNKAKEKLAKEAEQDPRSPKRKSSDDDDDDDEEAKKKKSPKKVKI